MPDPAGYDVARRATERLRLPPHSVEAEQALLGGLMLDQRAWDQIADVVAVDDFYRADHRLIFAAIGALIERNQPPDAVTVSEQLARQGQLGAAGGLAYLAQLVEETPSAANIRAYARIVRDRAMLRQLIQIGGDIAASAHDTEGRPVEELVDLAEQRVFEIADRGQRRGSGLVPLKQILPQTIDRLDVLSHTEGDITGVSTGFTDMDRMTAGLQRGDLIVIAGRPSMGKCVVAGSRVLDPSTGRLEEIDELVRRRRATVVAVDERGRLGPASASAFVDDGVKPVFEVRTALGRRIAVTATHPFLTMRGWQRLEVLRPGVHIGVPRTLPFFGARPLAEPLVGLAAYFVSSGGRARTVPAFASADARLRADFGAAVGHFSGVRCRDAAGAVHVVHDGARLSFAARLRDAVRGRRAPLAAPVWRVGTTVAALQGAAPQGALLLAPAGIGRDAEPASGASARDGRDNPVRRWLADLGLWGVAARRKRVPDAIFELPREQLALFLNRLFACDGGFTVGDDGRIAIRYATASERLARDVQHLLLRFGVVARLRRRPDAAHELRIASPEDVGRFVRDVGIFGQEDVAARALEACASHAATAVDAEPAATGDVHWDRIEAIDYLGPRRVYDLTVPGLHNFVAEDLIVHNTTFAVNIAENAAIGSQVPTAIFSMEMSAEQLSFRMIGSIGRVNQQRLRTGKLSDEDWSRIDSAVSMMSNAPIFIDDSPGLTPTEVRARARRLKREHGLGLIVVDYLQLMQVSGTVENRATEISEISRSLKALAKELDLPVIALSQLNRSVEQRTDKRPVMSDLRESGAIEQDADLIVFIYREEVYEPETPRKGVADIIIGKQRNGPVGEFHLTFLGEFTKFENLVAEAYGEGVF